MPSSVNNWSKRLGSSTTNSVTVAPSAGHNLIVAVNVTSAVTIGISDNLGTLTWRTALAPATGSSTAYIAIYYAENIPSGVTSVTATYGAAAVSSIFVDEVNGLATASSLDAVSTLKGAHSSSGSSNPITPAGSGEYAFAFLGDAGSNVTMSSWTGGFTAQQSIANAPSSGWADQVVGGSVTAGVTLSASTDWSMAVALFVAAAGPSQAMSAVTGSALATRF